MTSEEALAIEVEPAAHDDLEFARRSDAYLSRALGLAYYILGDRHEAEDATQEAMTRAWKSRRSLRQIESFDAWIDRIVVNSCRERMRRRRNIREIALPEGVEPEAMDRYGALLARDSIGRALGELTLDQRTVVILRYWRDLSLEQIAERLNWPLGTVKSRLHYALAALRERLERDESEVLR
ncbi:MAG: RNA polymerase sigma factor [Candidatus Limnocylindrales bacterium]|jgi:RNA polymerase sigma-70 factor (ECF subfamily)